MPTIGEERGSRSRGSVPFPGSGVQSRLNTPFPHPAVDVPPAHEPKHPLARSRSSRLCTLPPRRRSYSSYSYGRLAGRVVPPRRSTLAGDVSRRGDSTDALAGCRRRQRGGRGGSDRAGRLNRLPVAVPASPGGGVRWRPRGGAAGRATPGGAGPRPRLRGRQLLRDGAQAGDRTPGGASPL